MKKYTINTKKITAWIGINDKNIITESMPVFSKFKGQPIQNLTNWLLKIFGGYNLKRFEEE